MKYPEISHRAFEKQQRSNEDEMTGSNDIAKLVDELEAFNEELDSSLGDLKSREEVGDKIQELTGSDQFEDIQKDLIAELMVKLFVNFEEEMVDVPYFSTKAKIIQKASKHKVFAGLAYLAAAYLSVITGDSSSKSLVNQAYMIMSKSKLRKQLFLAYSTHLVFQHQNQDGLKFLKLVLKKFKTQGLGNKAKMRFYLLNMYYAQFTNDSIAKQLWLDKYQSLVSQ